MKTSMKANHAPERDLFTELSEGMPAFFFYPQSIERLTASFFHAHDLPFHDNVLATPSSRLQFAGSQFAFQHLASGVSWQRGDEVEGLG